MTMKLKKLFLAIFATSVLFVSCTKDDVYDPIKTPSTVTTESLTMKSMSTSPTVSGTVNKAYIFVESRINGSPRKVVDYLNNAVKNIRDFSLYTNSEDFEEVFIDDITKELLKQNDI